MSGTRVSALARLRTGADETIVLECLDCPVWQWTSSSYEAWEFALAHDEHDWSWRVGYYRGTPPMSDEMPPSPLSRSSYRRRVRRR